VAQVVEHLPTECETLHPKLQYLQKFKRKYYLGQVIVDYTCNPSYLGS
jgi:hypothetical protein